MASNVWQLISDPRWRLDGMSTSWEMFTPLDILAAAIRKHLRLVRFTEEHGLGSAAFNLHHPELGDDLGKLELRKLSEDRTELTISGPQRLPIRSLTQEELDALNAVPDKEDRQRRFIDLRRKIEEEGNEPHNRRRGFFDKAIRLLCSKLEHDLFLREAERTSTIGSEQAEPQTDSGAVGEQLTLAEDAGGKKPGQIDTKLEALLVGQTAIREDLSGLRQAVLARFDTSEKTIIATVIERLDQGQLATVQAVLDTIEAELVPIGELEETLVAVQHTLSEIQQQGVALPDSTLASEVERLSEVVYAPKLDAKHKLKVTVPIIPFLLSYEGEVELKSGLNLEAIWKRLVARARGT